MTSKSTQATIWLLVSTFFWGVTFVFVKEAIDRIDIYLFIALRFLIAGGVLFFIFFRTFLRSSLRVVKYGLIISLPLSLGYMTQTIGLQTSSASKVGFITGLSVVFVPIIMACLRRNIPSFGKIVAVVMATIGLGMLSLTSLTTSAIEQGDIWALVGALAFSVHIVLVARYSHAFDARQITGFQLLGVGVTSSVFAIFLCHDLGQGLYAFDIWMTILFCALFATVLVFLAQNYFQRYISPFKLTVIFSFEPLFAFAMGYFYLGEPITIQIVLGGFLIVGAMLVPEWSPFSKNHKKNSG